MAQVCRGGSHALGRPRPDACRPRGDQRTLLMPLRSCRESDMPGVPNCARPGAAWDPYSQHSDLGCPGRVSARCSRHDRYQPVFRPVCLPGPDPFPHCASGGFRLGDPDAHDGPRLQRGRVLATRRVACRARDLACSQRCALPVRCSQWWRHRLASCWGPSRWSACSSSGRASRCRSTRLTWASSSAALQVSTRTCGARGSSTGTRLPSGTQLSHNSRPITRYSSC